MDWGGIIANALGGGAQAASDIAQQQIDTNQKASLAKTMADVDQAKQIAIDQARQNMQVTLAAQERQRRADAYTNATKDLPPDAGPMGKLRAGITGALASGDPATAAEYSGVLDKSYIKGNYGSDIYDALTGQVVGGSSALRAANAGGGAKNRAAQFDVKEWDHAFDPPKEVITVADPVSGKELRSPDLSRAYQKEFMRLKATGDYSPLEAKTMASDATTDLNNAAQAVMQTDPKLTHSNAVAVVLKQAADRLAAARKAADGAAADPAATPAPPPPPAPAPPAAPSVQSQIDAAKAPVASSGYADRANQRAEASAKADADPDLQWLAAQRDRALRDGKTLDANNAIARMNQLRKMRYGL